MLCMRRRKHVSFHVVLIIKRGNGTLLFCTWDYRDDVGVEQTDPKGL